MIHELKTDSDVFGKIKSFEKTFEIRVNDRDFKEGDILKLRETVFTGEQMKEGMPLIYTGKVVFVSVIYI